MKPKPTIAKVLISFVLITVGFILGKEYSARSIALPQTEVNQRGIGDERVVVYYMHTTIRCVTCNQIEKMAAALVDREFAAAREKGRLEWKDVDFQKNESLAKKYDVASSCVVVVRIRDGQEVDFKRLDDVWTLSEKPKEFDAYLAEAIRAFLGEGKA